MPWVHCLLLVVGSNGGVYGKQADAAMAEGNRRQWTVRSTLKYRWHSASKRCGFEAFQRAKLCGLVQRKNVVLVGDSGQSQFYNTLLNHLLTEADIAASVDRWLATVSSFPG